MSVETLTDGSIFSGRYKVLRRIAAGGMGAVYEVLHQETARRRALKVMHPHLAESDDFRSRFQTEARIAGQVDSRYIVDVFDAGVDETTKMPFLVMELLQGEELGKRLRRVGKFGFEETVGYLWQTALALDKTHKANIVHRDLKPDNLFLCESEDGPPLIKVLDFGIAKLMAEGGTQANVTRAMGTPLYMAPEQFKSKSKVSPATDIHALGMMAYMMLVGAPYWADEQATEDNPYAFAGIVMQGPPEPPTVRALRKGMRLPAAFDEWFGQATSPNPEQRFFKATVAIRGLAQALGVAVPMNTKELAGATTGSSATVTGQTTPGQTGAGWTGSGQTGSGRTGQTTGSASGPQGTMVLAESSTTNSPSATGFGLATSQPRAASMPSVPPMDTPQTPVPIVQLNRGKTVPLMIAVVVGLAAVGIGVAVFGTKNTVVAPDANMAMVVPVSRAAESAVPVVVPAETEPVETSVVALEGASNAPVEMVVPDAGSFVDAGATIKDVVQPPTKLAPVKTSPTKAISTSPRKTNIYRRDD